MSLGLQLYRAATLMLGLFKGAILDARVRAGKEDPARINERIARRLRARPDGRVIWLHGASVGESLMLLGVGERLRDLYPDATLLFTSQTQTSAQLLSDQTSQRLIHQMAPLDTPGVAQRFIAHWKPNLLIVAEGDIWPNLLMQARQSGARTALVNARMTTKSVEGWTRWPSLAQLIFGGFDALLGADRSTSKALTRLSGTTVHTTGNLKAALPPPPTDAAEETRIRKTFLEARKCLVAASTHETEEALALDVLGMLETRPAVIIAPRHPERGDEVETLIARRGLSCARRSKNETAEADTDVLLADTLGEMGLWYSLADTVYLGGAHRDGVGGHNPLEPIRLGRPVVTGPFGFNFAELFAPLESAGALTIAGGATDVAKVIDTHLAGNASPIDPGALAQFFADAETPLDETIAALLPLMPEPPQ